MEPRRFDVSYQYSGLKELEEKGTWVLVGLRGDEEVHSKLVDYETAVQAMDLPLSKELDARISFTPTGKDDYIVVGYRGASTRGFIESSGSYSWYDPEDLVARMVVRGELRGAGGEYTWKDGSGEEYVFEVHDRGAFPFSRDMPTNVMPVRDGQGFLDSLVPVDHEDPVGGGSMAEEAGGGIETPESPEADPEPTDGEITPATSDTPDAATGEDAEPEDLADAARELQAKGHNVIPLRPLTPEAKRPFLKGGELKDEQTGLYHRRSTAEDVEEWKRRDRESRRKDPESAWRWEGLALVTGHTSGTFVVDKDSEEGVRLLRILGITGELMEKTPSWTTGRGSQIVFKIPEGLEIFTMIGFLPGVDVKGERGYAVIPPTVHHSGKSYEYVTSLLDASPMDPPKLLIDAIRLASGEGLSSEEYEALPEETVELIRERSAGRGGTSGSGGGMVEIDPFSDEVLDGSRNEVLFKKKACRYRYLGYGEEEIFDRLWRDNQVYCYPQPLPEEEVRDIAHKVCTQYEKGDPAVSEVLEIIAVVEAYYRANPPKGQSEHTRWAITVAYLEEALLHSTLVQDGIEVSIGNGQWSDKAGITERTLIRNKEKLFYDGAFKQGRRPRGTKTGSIVLVRSFYETCHHSTTNSYIEDPDLRSNTKKQNGVSGDTPHKTTPDLHRRRWGAGRFGKTRGRLLEVMEQVTVDAEENIITPKLVTDKLNEGVTDPEKRVKSTSLSYHFGRYCEDGILERVCGNDGKPLRGKYRLREDRYERLGDLMRATGEFQSVYDQRKRRKEKQEKFSRLLDEREGKRKDRFAALRDLTRSNRLLVSEEEATPIGSSDE